MSTLTYHGLTMEGIHEFVRNSVGNYAPVSAESEVVSVMAELVFAECEEDALNAEIALDLVIAFTPIKPERVSELSFAVAECGFVEFISGPADYDLNARLERLRQLYP